MISEDALSTAIADGVLTAAQAQQLRDIEAARVAVDPQPMDEERLRFVSGFSDIFVSIGLGLFLGAAAYFLDMIGAAAACLGVTVGAWALAEFFTARRRMALPSILLLIGFVGGVFMLAMTLLKAAALTANYDQSLIVAGPIAAISAWGHYRRFAVPITPAAGAAALVAMLMGALYVAFPEDAIGIAPFLSALCGAVLFVLALRLDRSDPERLTRRTDIAFWLHLLAGPLIVHPVMLYSGIWSDDGKPVVTILLFLALALVALAADRRAILVSSLLYAGIAIAYLARDRGMAEGTTAAFSMLVLGVVILLLSAGWRAIRHRLIAALPARWAAFFPRAAQPN